MIIFPKYFFVVTYFNSVNVFWYIFHCKFIIFFTSSLDLCESLKCFVHILVNAYLHNSGQQSR
jgi:hypothetical protein